MLLKIVILALCIVAYKFLLNLYNYKSCQKFYQLYLEWFSDQNDKLFQNRGRIVKLLKNAGVKDSFIPTSQPIGFGQVCNANASVYDNFPSNIQEFAALMYSKFQEAIGEYKSRMIESFNPLYWIDTILFLPKHLLSYLGVGQASLSFKIGNIVLTIIWWGICAGVTVLKPYIYDFIVHVVGNLS